MTQQKQAKEAFLLDETEQQMIAKSIESFRFVESIHLYIFSKDAKFSDSSMIQNMSLKQVQLRTYLTWRSDICTPLESKARAHYTPAMVTP